jgi:putative ABC transport system ATP-binding protein
MTARVLVQGIGDHASPEPTIRIRDLEFRYRHGDYRLSLPELAVSPGEAVAIIGPSGSGKTTLLNLIAGIITPRSGSVTVDGVTVGELSDRERRRFRILRIGFVFQDFALLDYLDVMDNILHPYRISPALVLTPQVRARADELAGELGIGSRLREHPDTLSHGEKQRVAICRALLPAPRLILADEATGNLDRDNKERILRLLLDDVEARDSSLLAVTHDEELLHHFHRVVDFRDLACAA